MYTDYMSTLTVVIILPFLLLGLFVLGAWIDQKFF